jgi:transcription elongation factor GreA
MMVQAAPYEPTGHTTASGQPSGVFLTPQGREALVAHAAWLEAERLPKLAHDRLDAGEDGWAQEEYRLAAAELARLRGILQRAASTHDLPEDPDVVQLGDEVVVDFGHDQTDRFLVVHPVEAPLDEVRISSDAPLAKAVLGRRVGEHVDVDAPAGGYRCRILSARRHPAAA